MYVKSTVVICGSVCLVITFPLPVMFVVEGGIFHPIRILRCAKCRVAGVWSSHFHRGSVMLGCSILYNSIIVVSWGQHVLGRAS